METPLRRFLEIPYDELESLNLQAKKRRADGVVEAEFEKEYRLMLKKEKGIKAVSICFSDIEGRFHVLDYDKRHILSEADNLTFDGSSVRGFSSLAESDLRLAPQWSSFRWLPTDVFGPGKVLMFATIQNRDRSVHESDFRGQLIGYMQSLSKEKLNAVVAPEIEGFLVDGVDAEQRFNERDGFKLISAGGYYHSLPKDPLRRFIDAAAEAQRAMGFENEKDHPEVAPSQFELNYKYAPVTEACDQIQLYKLTCRQIASSMGVTATFLPKPISGINGNGMHVNFSLQKAGKNAFYAKTGQYSLSALADSFASRLLNHAPEICLVLNPSVNAYRRLDPHFEAPNQIKLSPTDRGSMIRIPIGSPDSTRIEIRSVAPDVNPYLAMYTILRTGLEGKQLRVSQRKRARVRVLPGTISEALRDFKASQFVTAILGPSVQKKYAALKQDTADRSPKELGTLVKNSEVLLHHEVTNQVLWNQF